MLQAEEVLGRMERRAKRASAAVEARVKTTDLHPM
jgi:hypothetical protein